MKISSTLRTLAAACAFAVASQAGAAVLQVNTSGILTGAIKVNVAGMLYNVTFADGSCNSVFNGCVQSAFAFNTRADAIIAAQSLLDQVFVNGPEGRFDDFPERTFGCSSTSACGAIVPYALSGSTGLIGLFADNGSSTTTDFVGGISAGRSIDFRTYPQYTFAVFQSAAPAAVPEPTSIALFGLALAGLAFTRHRKA